MVMELGSVFLFHSSQFTVSNETGFIPSQSKFLWALVNHESCVTQVLRESV